MRRKCLAQGHYCRCQQIRTRDITTESPWSYLLSHNIWLDLCLISNRKRFFAQISLEINFDIEFKKNKQIVFIKMKMFLTERMNSNNVYQILFILLLCLFCKSVYFVI